MGNTPSSSVKSSEKAGGQPHSPGGTLQRERTERRRHHQQHTEQYYGEKREGAPGGRANGQDGRPREGLQALSSSSSSSAAKAQAAPPSLTSAVAHPTPAHSPSQARAIPTSTASPLQQPRNRSATASSTSASTATTPRSRAQDAADVSPRSNMGVEQSRHQHDSRHDKAKLDKSSRLNAPSPPSEPRLSPASQPVDVPAPAGGPNRSFQPSPLDPTADLDAYHLPPSSFSRPPRLPLPIEEEVHNPGSPIASPTDFGLDADELPRRSSVVSSTVDDDEEPDNNFEAYSTDLAGPKVPTIIEWRPTKPSDRVYVTGTFTNWERKFRLYKDGPSPHKDALSATLQLPPGTHHIKFIANGDMITSEALPTTVDYTNILVNYIEVSLDQVKELEGSSKSGSTTPTAVPAGPAAPSRPLDIRPKPASPSAQPVPQFSVPQQTPHYPPPPLSTQQSRPRSSSPKSTNPQETARPPPTATLVKQPSKNYTSQIPHYLLDIDSYVPSGKDHDASPAAQAARYRVERANAAADSQPAPPSLPMFLSKSILNGTTPMKDDSSVLIMPNHTVLNHLATTNIKQGVLATSATTRYKRKVRPKSGQTKEDTVANTLQFLTTIMYKPRSDDGD